jgi:hypothetical protein
MTDQELIDFLNRNPNVKNKLKNLAKVSDNVELSYTRGDDAEEAVINYSRELNKELLQSWGQQEALRIANNVEAQIPAARKHRLKKN